MGWNLNFDDGGLLDEEEGDCGFGLGRFRRASRLGRNDKLQHNRFDAKLQRVAGCVQVTSTTISDGGFTFTYNTGSESGIVTPSIINLGNIVATGTATNLNVTGLLLTLDVNSLPPGAGGTLLNGAISGTISTNNSGRRSFSARTTRPPVLVLCLVL